MIRSSISLAGAGEAERLFNVSEINHTPLG